MSIRSSRASSFAGFAFLGLAIVHLDSPASGFPAIGPGIIGSPMDDRQGRGAVRVHAATIQVPEREERSQLADPGPYPAVFISTRGEPAGSAHESQTRKLSRDGIACRRRRDSTGASDGPDGPDGPDG